MSGITNPAEEYFKDGLWGWVTNQWKKLISDDDGHLQVDVVSSDLPSGGATAANQTTMITALQLIDDLRNALNSIATDELDVIFDGQNADVEITQTTAADLTPGIQGWDGSAWRKLALLWGYSDIWDEDLGGTASSTVYYVTTAAIPAGYAYTLQAMSIRNNTRATTGVSLYVTRASGAQLHLTFAANLSQYVPLLVTGMFTLRQGDVASMYMASTQSGDVIKAAVAGYKMKITE